MGYSEAINLAMHKLTHKDSNVACVVNIFVKQR